jgi:hypothetical protein
MTSLAVLLSPFVLSTGLLVLLLGLLTLRLFRTPLASFPQESVNKTRAMDDSKTDDGQRVFSPGELSQFNGTQEGLPILLAVRGRGTSPLAFCEGCVDHL